MSRSLRKNQIDLLKDMMSSPVWKVDDKLFVSRKHPDRPHAIIVRVSRRTLDGLFEHGLVKLGEDGQYHITPLGAEAVEQ